MPESIVPMPQDLENELLNSFHAGPIIDDAGFRYVTEVQVAKIGGLKIEIFANEHPPPHFRVHFQGESNNFSISDCTPLNGTGLRPFWRNIREWHSDHKPDLIRIWNEFRPTNCPVGLYREPQAEGTHK